MTLFEIRTGWQGESYQRAYAWAVNEDDAVVAFKAKYPEREVRAVSQLFDSQDDPFVTELSDSGFEVNLD